MANVNPDNVRSHSDRVLYSAIGIFILLYFAYATMGGAVFVDTSSNYTHPWWRWLVGPLIALAVIAYDRAVVGRVATSFDDLTSDDPDKLLKARTFGLYIGRFVLALLVAVIVTEPLMLDRYKGEIDAYLNQVHNQAVEQASSAGTIKDFRSEKAKIDGQNAADDQAVSKLTASAADKRAQSKDLYNKAIADSQGDGVTHKAGCPAGGYCDTLVKQSRSLADEATKLDEEAAALRVKQQPDRDARAKRETELDTKIAAAQADNASAIRADSGFGARTGAMWHLILSDFFGIGVFYLGTALLLIALDCAAIALKLVSHGNAYERAEARQMREQELLSGVRHRRAVATAQKAEEKLHTITSEIVTEVYDRAGEERRLHRDALHEAQQQVRDNVFDTMQARADAGRPRGFRRRRGASPRPARDGDGPRWPASEPDSAGHTDPLDDPDDGDGATRGWVYQ